MEGILWVSVHCLSSVLGKPPVATPCPVVGPWLVPLLFEMQGRPSAVSGALPFLLPCVNSGLSRLSSGLTCTSLVSHSAQGLIVSRLPWASGATMAVERHPAGGPGGPGHAPCSSYHLGLAAPFVTKSPWKVSSRTT